MRKSEHKWSWAQLLEAHKNKNREEKNDEAEQGRRNLESLRGRDAALCEHVIRKGI